jgi:hypothetical protein
MVEKKDSEITNLKIEIQINEERMTELKMQEEHAHKESIENQSKNLDMSKRVESLDDCIKKHQVKIYLLLIKFILKGWSSHLNGFSIAAKVQTVGPNITSLWYINKNLAS